MSARAILRRRPLVSVLARHLVGEFLRTFTLPEDSDAKKIAAEFKDGMLKVHLPKSPTAKPQVVDVKVQ